MLRVAEAVHRTDVGRQREANEDSLFSRAPVFAVADGMGGAQAGEVASRIAVAAFEPELPEDAGPEPWLRETAQRANREIFELAQGDSSRSGMGTTLTAALVSGDEVSFGHVGDSRAYLLRDGELSQLTNDHSLVEELRRQGKLTKEQAAEHPQRSVITRALGPEPDVAVDTMTVQARPGDVFLLCSDGLTTMISDEDVSSVLTRSDNLDEAARKLIRAANERGGRDNITVILFRLEEVGVGQEEESATLIGPTAEAEGFTAENVRAGAAAASSARMEKPIAVPSGRGESGSRWPRRIFRTLIALLVVAAIAFGAWYGNRQVWFLGTDDAGRVTLYRGLPYELPFGVDLYSEYYSSPVTLSAVPEERRDAATNHTLRSRDDAESLLDDLQKAAESNTATGTGTTPGGGTGTGTGRGTGTGTPTGPTGAGTGSGTGGSGGSTSGAGSSTKATGSKQAGGGSG
jgi:serine/threonine protein phosphatase PrpC